MTSAQQELATRWYPYVQYLARRIATSGQEYEDAVGYLSVCLVRVCAKWREDVPVRADGGFVIKGMNWAFCNYWRRRKRRPGAIKQYVDNEAGALGANGRAKLVDALASLQDTDRDIVRLLGEGLPMRSVAARVRVPSWKIKQRIAEIEETLNAHSWLGY